jgi:hypothetical protein
MGGHLSTHFFVCDFCLWLIGTPYNRSFDDASLLIFPQRIAAATFFGLAPCSGVLSTTVNLLRARLTLAQTRWLNRVSDEYGS